MEAVKHKIESEQIKVHLLTETDTKAKSEERKVQVPANFNNKRLNTPGFVRLQRYTKDGFEVLKTQITQSNLRIKAVKFGNSVRSVAPDHSLSYYVPYKENYIDKISMIKRKINA